MAKQYIFYSVLFMMNVLSLMKVSKLQVRKNLYRPKFKTMDRKIIKLNI